MTPITRAGRRPMWLAVELLSRGTWLALVCRSGSARFGRVNHWLERLLGRKIRGSQDFSSGLLSRFSCQ